LKATVIKTQEGKNIRKRRANICFYCNEKHTRIQRHFMAKHQNEEDVIKIANSEGAAQKALVEKLVNEGNFRQTWAELNLKFFENLNYCM